MRTKIIALSALAAFSLATTAFAGVTTPPKTAAPAAATTHTPMTPAQEQALWQAAQTKLKADRLYSGPVNGERTDDTISAIRMFQSRHQLPESGQLDHATRQALGI